MAKSDGTVYVDTLIDTKGFGKGVNTMQKQVSGLSGAIGKLGAAIAATFAVGKLIQFGKEAIQLGSDLEEVQNVVDVTFTTMNEQVNEFARNAAESAGLSETMAKRYVGTFGAMSKVFGFAENEAFEMSTALTQLAGDVASFYNISQDEAYTKLKSVFTGETETLKDLGVVMTQNALDSYAMAKGYGKTTKAMTEQEKVALRYSFVLDQLSASQGDFVRTSDSWANQTRILSLTIDSLKANIGQGLINIFTPLLKVINQVVDKMAELSKYFVAFSELIVGKSTSGGGGSPGDALAEIQDGYDGITDSTKEAAKAQNKYLTGLDEIKTFSDNKSVDTSTGGAGGLAGLAGSTAGEVADTASLIEKLEQKYPELIKFAQDSIAKLKEIFADFAAGDFFEAGQDTSDLITGIFNFFADAIDSVDWKGIGNKIGDYLAGIDWIEVIKAGFRLKFNIWKAIAEVWLGMFDAAPLETAVITAIAALKFTPLGGILSKNIISALSTGTLVKDIRTWLSGGLVGGGGFIAKLGDALALTFGGAGTLSESLKAVFGTVGTTIAGIVSTVGGAILAITNFVDMLKNGFSWLNEILMVIGIAIAAVGAVILGAPAAIAAVVAAIVAAVGTLVVVIKDNWDTICGWFASIGDWFKTKVIDPIAEFFKQLWTNVSEFFSNLWDDVSAIWGKVSEWFKNHVIEPVVNFFQNLWAKVKQVFEGLWIVIQAIWKVVSGWFNENVVVPVVDFFKNLWKSVSGFFSQLWTDIKTIWSTVFDWFNQKIIEPVKNAFEKACDAIGDFFSGLWYSIKLGVVGAMNAVIGGIESAINFIVNGINKIIGGFNQVVSWAAKVAEVNWGGVDLISQVSIPRVNVPMLATGAVIPPNAPFMAMLGDQKNGNNLEMPENLLRKIIREESGNSGGNNNYTFQCIISRRVLFEEFIEEAKLQKSMTGRNPLDLAGGV